ncbi:MAG: hypothetical protein WCK83_17005, partial [Burkholderiales bacterium]
SPATFPGIAKPQHSRHREAVNLVIVRPQHSRHREAANLVIARLSGRGDPWLCACMDCRAALAMTASRDRPTCHRQQAGYNSPSSVGWFPHAGGPSAARSTAKK